MQRLLQRARLNPRASLASIPLSYKLPPATRNLQCPLHTLTTAATVFGRWHLNLIFHGQEKVTTNFFTHERSLSLSSSHETPLPLPLPLGNPLPLLPLAAPLPKPPLIGIEPLVEGALDLDEGAGVTGPDRLGVALNDVESR